MVDQAQDRGILFWPALVEHNRAKADPLGRIYDSRSGFKAYYRYNPRRIEWLTNGQVHERGFFRRSWPKPSPTVTVERPKIHESVLARIASAPEAYAPIVFPERYAVVMKDGSILDGEKHPFERPAESAARARAQEAAWNLVWWRRLVYFLTVIASVVLAIRPIWNRAANSEQPAEPGMVTRVVDLVGDMLPSMASPWIEYYAAHPWELVVVGGIVLLLMQAGRVLQGAICDEMRSVWLHVTAASDPELGAIDAPRGLLYRMRSAPSYQGAFAVLRRMILPHAFGIVTLLFLAVTAYRVASEAASVAGSLWRGSTATASLGVVRDSR
jgi:hypothetical protein